MFFGGMVEARDVSNSRKKIGSFFTGGSYRFARHLLRELGWE